MHIFHCIYSNNTIDTVCWFIYFLKYIQEAGKDMVKKDEPEVIENEKSEDLIEDTTDNKEE